MKHEWDFIDWAAAGSLSLGLAFITVVVVKGISVETAKAKASGVTVAQRVGAITGGVF